MGGQKLKLSSVKSYRKKRKERLARKVTKSSATLPRKETEIEVTNSLAETDEASLLVSLPLISYTCGKAKSLNELHNRLVKNGGYTGWQVIEATANRLTLAMKLVPSPPACKQK